MGMLILLVAGPGYPFAALLRKLGINMGAGSGDQVFWLIAAFFGLAIWTFTIAGGIFLWQHSSFTFTP
jgi:hypothetical protein